jgi:NADH:ubiquinone oxidoreductase subunit F (NADH-binding)
MVSRFGPEWFRSTGTTGSPGTVLLTVTGRWAEPTVLEVPLGLSFRDALSLPPDTEQRYQGALLGGYGGGWVTMADLLECAITEEATRQLGSSLGAGVVALLPRSVCAVAETARIVRYMEQHSAGQCGPCLYGLGDLATTMEALAWNPSSFRGRFPSIVELCDVIEGRGACRHPDGVTRFVRSALVVFRDHVTEHHRRGPCAPAAGPGLLPCPARPGAAR